MMRLNALTESTCNISDSTVKFRLSPQVPPPCSVRRGPGTRFIESGHIIILYLKIGMWLIMSSCPVMAPITHKMSSKHLLN